MFLGHTAGLDSDNNYWVQLGRLREYSKVPDCADYSGHNETAIDLNF